MASEGLLELVETLDTAARKAAPITQKELTKELRLLEVRGLVTPKARPIVPLHVEYEATPIARELIGSLESIARWMRLHSQELDASI